MKIQTTTRKIGRSKKEWEQYNGIWYFPMCAKLDIERETTENGAQWREYIDFVNPLYLFSAFSAKRLHNSSLNPNNAPPYFFLSKEAHHFYLFWQHILISATLVTRFCIPPTQKKKKKILQFIGDDITNQWQANLYDSDLIFLATNIIILLFYLFIILYFQAV